MFVTFTKRFGPAFTLSLLLTACQSLPTSKPATCPNAKLPCVGTDNIMVLSREDAEVEATARNTAITFETIFGKKAPPTLIVPGGKISAEESTAFRENGFKTLLPWLDTTSRNQLKENSIRKQVLEQTKDLPKSVQDAALQQALSQLGANNASPDRSIELGALAHELGHMWFIANYKNDNEPAAGHAYGGWAPDWLDETVAVLMENKALKADRRTHFIALDASRHIPLAEFFTMEHPSAQAVKSLDIQTKAAKGKPKASSGSTIRVLSGEEAKAFLNASGGNRAVDFYAQVLMFSDYLTERAGGTAVFPDIAGSLADGNTLSEWLTGNPYGMPTTISDLETDWKDWLSNRP